MQTAAEIRRAINIEDLFEAITTVIGYVCDEGSREARYAQRNAEHLTSAQRPEGWFEEALDAYYFDTLDEDTDGVRCSYDQLLGRRRDRFRQFFCGGRRESFAELTSRWTDISGEKHYGSGKYTQQRGRHRTFYLGCTGLPVKEEAYNGSQDFFLLGRRGRRSRGAGGDGEDFMEEGSDSEDLGGDHMVRGGRTLSTLARSLGAVLQSPSDRGRVLADDASSARTDRLLFDQPTQIDGTQESFDDVKVARENRKRGPLGTGESGLEVPSEILLEGKPLLSKGRDGEQKRAARQGLCDVRGDGRLKLDTGGDGDKVVFTKRAEIVDGTGTISSHFQCPADGGTVRGMVLRCDGHTKNLIRSGVRANGWTECVYQPPDVKYVGLKAVVSWADEPGSGDHGRRARAKLPLTTVLTNGGSDAVSGGSQRSLCLFYVKSVVRDNTGAAMAVLAAVPDGTRSSMSEGVVRAAIQPHDYGFITVDPTGLPGFCCIDPKLGGYCRACYARRSGGGTSMDVDVKQDELKYKD